MKELKCPNCGQIFTVDESGYAQIVSQVRDHEFAQELQKREQELRDERKLHETEEILEEINRKKS